MAVSSWEIPQFTKANLALNLVFDSIEVHFVCNDLKSLESWFLYIIVLILVDSLGRNLHTSFAVINVQHMNDVGDDWVAEI